MPSCFCGPRTRGVQFQVRVPVLGCTVIQKHLFIDDGAIEETYRIVRVLCKRLAQLFDGFCILGWLVLGLCAFKIRGCEVTMNIRQFWVGFEGTLETSNCFVVLPFEEFRSPFCCEPTRVIGSLL